MSRPRGDEDGASSRSLWRRRRSTTSRRAVAATATRRPRPVHRHERARRGPTLIAPDQSRRRVDGRPVRADVLAQVLTDEARLGRAAGARLSRELVVELLVEVKLYTSHVSSIHISDRGP